MKIALLASTFLPRVGGAEMVVHNLAMGLQERGHDVTVITWWGLWAGVRGRVPYRVMPLLPRSFTHGARRRWEAGRGSTGFVGAQIAALQRVFRFDVWNIHMAYPLGMLAAPTLARLGVPVVTTCHGDDLIIKPELGFVLRSNPHMDCAIRTSFELSSKVTAISPFMRREFEAAGLPSAKIVDVPNGVHVGHIAGMQVDRIAVRRRWGLGGEDFLILSVGRNHPQKGYDLIPGILKGLAEKGCRPVWMVVGQGLETLRVAGDAAQLGGRLICVPQIGGRKRDELLKGRTPARELVELLRAADVFALPSYFEGMPLVLLEAMAAGLPVVTTDVDGCIDTVGRGDAALITPAGDGSAMADALRELMSDAGLRERLSARGRDRAARHDWPVIVGLYEKAYNDAREAAR